MAKQVIDRGAFVDDPTAENLYVAFGKAIANFDELYNIGEKTSAGVLVYPTAVSQTIAYNADSSVDTFTCSYGGFTWTLKMTTYNAAGNVELMTADNGAGGSSWTKSFTYDTDGTTLLTEGGWV